MLVDGRFPDKFFSNPGTASMRVALKRLQAIMLHYGETVVVKGLKYNIATKTLCPGVFEVWLILKSRV